MVTIMPGAICVIPWSPILVRTSRWLEVVAVVTYFLMMTSIPTLCIHKPGILIISWWLMSIPCTYPTSMIISSIMMWSRVLMVISFIRIWLMMRIVHRRRRVWLTITILLSRDSSVRYKLWLTLERRRCYRRRHCPISCALIIIGRQWLMTHWRCIRWRWSINWIVVSISVNFCL